MEKILKSLTINAVEDKYIRPLRNRHTGYANVTTLQILTHLYRAYGNITAADLTANDSQMKHPYDPNDPIEVLFNQIETAVEFAAAGGAPYNNTMVVQIAYQKVFETGLFVDACPDWRWKAVVDKTWNNFKIDFTAAHQDLRESQVTATAGGYHSANMAETLPTTPEALANLASGTAADRNAVAHLTSTNHLLTKQLAECMDKLQTAEALIITLKKQLADKCRSCWDHGTYCWSHGYNVGKNHTSLTCRNKQDGHKDEATRANTMGGSRVGKPSE